MALNQNQFAMSVVQGQMDLRFNPSVIAARIDATSAGNVAPGTPMKIVSKTTAGVPNVVECAADTDDVFGFVSYNLKNQNFDAGDLVDLAAMRDNVMYLTASAAIASNAKVMIVVSGVKVATATSGKTIVGRALDGAAAAGQLIRVYIDLPGVAA